MRSGLRGSRKGLLYSHTSRERQSRDRDGFFVPFSRRSPALTEDDATRFALREHARTAGEFRFLNFEFSVLVIKKFKM